MSEPQRYRVVRKGANRFAVMRGEETLVLAPYKRARALAHQFNRTNPSEAELEAYIAAGPRRGRR